MKPPKALQTAQAHALASLQAASTGDLVDRIFEYLTSCPALLQADADIDAVKARIRQELGGDSHYVRRRGPQQSDHAPSILALFNGRNATEVARRLGISRATVYRVLKQAGRG